MSDDRQQPSRGELDTAAIVLHEMLEAYMRAGFTRTEALDLVKTNIAAAGPGGAS